MPLFYVYICLQMDFENISAPARVISLLLPWTFVRQMFYGYVGQREFSNHFISGL
jgi:hypothetical protein